MRFELKTSKGILPFYSFALFLVLSCHHAHKEPDKFFHTRLIDFLNDNLNEAIIQDGFSPPVSSRIYAYVNLAAYEAYHYNHPDKLELDGVLNDFHPDYNFSSEQKIDEEFAAFTAFYQTAYGLVYRDYLVDSLIVSQKKYYKSKLDGKVYRNSEDLGKSVAREILSYAKTDNYLATRSYPLYELSEKPGAWEPTPPYYNTPIEPFWGNVKPFLIENLDSFKAPEHIEFDSIKGSPFFDLNYDVYQRVMQATKEQKAIAMYWDGDPMPAYRLKRVVISRRQLNPVGHWLALSKALNNVTGKTESQAIEIYMRCALTTADAMIVGWKNKYAYDLIRPHTYINRYIDAKWDPVLVTPAFPEYPSGHSMISGSCGATLIHFFGDSIAFVDSSQIKFSHESRTYNSVSEAINECAQSRIFGGVHYAPAVEEGVQLGRKIAELHIRKLHRKMQVASQN